MAPDSRTLVAANEEGRLVREPSADGRRTVVAAFAFAARWSGTGALATHEARGLALRGGAGTRWFALPTVDPSECGGFVTLVGWLDGTSLLLAGGHGGQRPSDLWLVDPAAGITQRVTPNRGVGGDARVVAGRPEARIRGRPRPHSRRRVLRPIPAFARREQRRRRGAAQADGAERR